MNEIPSGRTIAESLMQQHNRIMGYLPSRQMLDTVFEPVVLLGHGHYRELMFYLTGMGTYAAPDQPPTFNGMRVHRVADPVAQVVLRLKEPK